MDCLVRLMLGGLKTRLLTTCTKLGFVSTQCKQSGVGSPIATGKSLVWIFLKKYKCQYSPLLRKCDVRRKKWRQFCLLNFPGSLSNQCQLITNSLSFSFSFLLIEVAWKYQSLLLFPSLLFHTSYGVFRVGGKIVEYDAFSQKLNWLILFYLQDTSHRPAAVMVTNTR